MDFSKVKSALEARGYHVTVCADKQAASDYLNAQIDGTSVAFGGSVTLQELGVQDSLCAHNRVCNHWTPAEGESVDQARVQAMQTPVYLCSVNALAETGELVNIDGRGNRVSSTLFGHEKVYFIVGRNKLAPDCDAAIHRARNIAAPKNARRLGVQTPCAAKADRCYDCNSPQRICRALSVLWGPTTGCEMEVVLVDAELGY